MQQSSEMDLEAMLIDILDNKTAIGLSEEELLGTCEMASATVQKTQVPTTAVQRKKFFNLVN